MKPADRRLALKAVRIHRNQAGDTAAVARKLRRALDDVQVILYRGNLINQCEGYRLTKDETLVMATLARLEARRVHLGTQNATVGQVDFAAGKRSGWAGRVVAKRLRQPRLDEGDDHTKRLNLIAFPRDAGPIWLTPAGWAFVWAARLTLKNWKVPA